MPSFKNLSRRAHAHAPSLRRAARGAVTCLAAFVTTAALAQQHAHTHGRLALDVAVDERTITVAMEAPLDNFLGFERAPRTDAERRAVADMVARLKAADRLFVPDPQAGCVLSTVELASEVLGLGDAKAAAGGAAQAKATPPKAGAAAAEHADIDVSIVFNCQKAGMARQLEVRLFQAFPKLRNVDAQVASGQGQVKRRLTAAAPLLLWGTGKP